MSDSNNPYGSGSDAPPPSNPYGSGEGPPHPTNPYGQPGPTPSSPSGPEYAGPPPAGQPYAQQPYAQQPTQQPYGQQPYGQAPYGGQQPYNLADPNKRPGTVTAASIITMVITGLGTIGFAIATLAVLVARDDIVDEVRGDSNFQDLDISGDGIATFLVVVFVLLTLWCVATFVLALIAMRGKGWARIMVVVSAGISALFSLLAILSGVSVVTLIAAIAVIVLYFTGGANDWYKAKAAAGR